MALGKMNRLKIRDLRADRERQKGFAQIDFNSYFLLLNLGRLAQLVRAPALHAGGHWFESSIAHHFITPWETRGLFLFPLK